MMLRAEKVDAVITFLSQEESQKQPTHKINSSVHNPTDQERLLKEKGKSVKK